MLFSAQGLDAMLYGTLTPVAGGAADIHPLLYYITLNIWMSALGQGALAVRLWSVALGVVTVGLIAVLGRDLFDARTGLAAALVTALAPFHVQYSQEARMYALLGLLLVAATFCFVRGSRALDAGTGWRRGLGWWAAFGLLAGLAMYAQQLAAFYLTALGVVPLLARRPGWMRGVLFGTVVAVVVYFPWLVNLPSQFEKVRSYYWLSSPNSAQFLLTARSFMVVNLDIPAPASMIGFLGALFILVFLAVQAGLALRRPARRDRRPLLLVLWLAAAPPALMWLVSQAQPVYLERALLPSALMLYLALGWLFVRSGLPRPVSILIGAAGLGLAGLGLYYQYTWAAFPNSPFQDAAAFIRQHAQVGDRVLHQNKLTALPMIYYARDLPQRYLADRPGAPEDTLALPTQQALGLLADPCIQAVGGAPRLWWVTFDFAERQYADAGRTEFTQALEWLRAFYHPVETRAFNDLQVTLYVAVGAMPEPQACPVERS